MEGKPVDRARSARRRGILAVLFACALCGCERRLAQSDSVEVWSAALDHADESVRRDAARAVLEAFGAGDVAPRVAARDALKRIDSGAATAAEVFAGAVEIGAPDAAADALLALIYMGGKAEPARAAVLRAMTSETEEHRVRAAAILGNLARDPESEKILRAARQDRSSTVRFHASLALTRLGVQRDPLRDILRKGTESDDPEVREEAERLLEEMDAK
ncbi:MAG: HEAT repeat domain-containing protein [Planctomycetes bacterium]|nr:HEAT repeat domain-containing protein [Planctomycetota bacterium]